MKLSTVNKPNFDTTSIPIGIPIRVSHFKSVTNPDTGVVTMELGKVFNGIVCNVDPLQLRIVSSGTTGEFLTNYVRIAEIVDGTATVDILDVPREFAATEHIVTQDWLDGLIAIAQANPTTPAADIMTNYLAIAPFEVV